MKATKKLVLASFASVFVTMANAQSAGQVASAPAVPQQTVAASAQQQKPLRPERVVISIDKFEETDGTSADDVAQLRERIVHRLVGTRKFEVVERKDLMKVLSEIRLSTGGLTDPSMAPRQGKLKAAGFVVYGRLLFCGAEKASVSTVGLATTRERFKCEFQMKVSDVETGVVLASKVVTGTAQRNSITMSEVQVKPAASEDPLRRDAMDEAAAFAVDALREQLYPARVVRADSRYATVNMTSTEVHLNELFDVFTDGGEMFDPETGASLGNEGEYLGRMKVVIPGAKTSMLEPVDGLPMNKVRVGGVIRRVSKEKLEAEREESHKPADSRFKNRF